MTPYDSETMQYRGFPFRVDRFYDGDMREPWVEHDGHGVVSDWTTREKKPGERILISDRGSHRYYDFAETQAIALRDGWSCEEARSVEGLSVGATLTKKQIAAIAVEADYKHLKAWCNDEWHWCGVKVTLIGEVEFADELSESLWGIESDSGDYFKEVAQELADEIIAQIKRQATEDLKIDAMMAC